MNRTISKHLLNASSSFLFSLNVKSEHLTYGGICSLQQPMLAASKRFQNRKRVNKITEGVLIYNNNNNYQAYALLQHYLYCHQASIDGTSNPKIERRQSGLWRKNYQKQMSFKSSLESAQFVGRRRPKRQRKSSKTLGLVQKEVSCRPGCFGRFNLKFRQAY